MSKLTKYIADKLIQRAKRTPYKHLDGYMNRWWLFNPYQDSTGAPVKRNWLLRMLPSVRIHQILKADDDRHLHDHPWDARTVILKGWYDEIREEIYPEYGPTESAMMAFGVPVRMHHRVAGDTVKLNFGEYHRITRVSAGGVFTLFITYRYRGTWGFKVHGKKIPYFDYLAGKE